MNKPTGHLLNLVASNTSLEFGHLLKEHDD